VNDETTEDLLRELAPQVLGAVARRHGDFAGAEDAVQEALLAASTQWPARGRPDNPAGWLITVASRRFTDQHRQDVARRRREEVAASWSIDRPPDPAPEQDDSLIVLFMCCHPALTPGAAIPLTLRAVGGLTTKEIASAFLVPEATMAQRISRAKAKVKESGEPVALPSADERAARLASVLHVLYLLFNEGYATSSGPDLARTDLSGEAIRLTRTLQAELPDEPEVGGLLALMLLTDARRLARTDDTGAVVPLPEQDRSRWDHDAIEEGSALLDQALRSGPAGEYALQAAIALEHDRAASHDDTRWDEIAARYGQLEELTGNPMVTLNRAAAVAMAEGPDAGLAVLDPLADVLGEHHRWHAVRAHLLEQAGRREEAHQAYGAAADRAANQREKEHLIGRAARLAGEQPA
jgi:RNA polymerase sigma factor (sigma-70 family)